MAATAPMRDGPPAGSGTGGDSRVTTTSASSAAAATTTNFEYDESEWDIGIGNLIIDLDADIEKTNEKSNVGNLTSSSSSSMAAASATNAASGGSGSSSKTSKSSNSSSGNGATNTGSNTQSSTVEHSSTVDNKGLKMKIKRTKSGSKSSEKHEIVKPNEQNGGEAALCNSSNDVKGSTSKHSMSGSSASVNSNVNSTNVTASTGSNCGSASTGVNNVSNKRGGSSHRRDKTKDKHPQSGDKAVSKSSTLANQSSIHQSVSLSGSSNNVISTPDLNGIVRTPVQRMFPIQTNGPGPPNAPGPPASPSKEPSSKQTSSAFSSTSIPTTCATQQTAQVTATSVATNAITSGSLNQSSAASTSVSSGVSSVSNSVENATSASTNANAGSSTNTSNSNVYTSTMDEVLPRPQSPSSPPCKKIKTANCLINDKETKDACVGTSISTMTEPDCLGPCEPGTSVTLEGIVWHETEGVLVVNVTWRGKTYVGTLLDCTRHDWAPPRFCDSPTSDLDTRLPKGRAKRGRAVTDLSNFTETRSSVHSKLRSSSNGSNKGTRKGLSNSPTPFVPPRLDSGSGKRKSRPSEEDSASPQANGKKIKPSNQTAPVSPPSSPVFFECPEANCCKKYKHINGLKYHQSHAHGGACGGDDDDATKESGSMSENEELPSPVDQQSIKSERKDENSESEPATPISDSVSTSLNHPNSPHTQSVAMNLISELEPPVPVEPSPPPVDNKTVVKPSVLRYGVPGGIEDLNVPQTTTSTVSKTSLTTSVVGIRPVATPISTLSSNLPLTLTSSTASQPHSLPSPSPPSISQQVPLSPSQTTTSGIVPLSFSAAQQLQQTPAVQSLPLNPTASPKLPQFKVKPASALLQDDKTKDKSKMQVPRKKNRKSPGGSPHSHTTEQSQYKLENPSSREEVRSPAYSDISDDGAPVLEAEVSDSKKPLPMDKKSLDSNGAQSPHAMQHYNNIYSFYGQPPFLVPSVQPESKSKDDKVQDSKMNPSEKEKKENELPQKLLPSYYPFDYVPTYSYNIGPNYAIPMVASNNSEKEIKDENSKSPGPTDLVKQPSNVHTSQNLNQYSSSVGKSKMETQGKIQSEPYSSVKDNSEARSPLNSSSFLHARQQQQQLQLQQQQLQQQQQMQQHMQQHQQQQSGLHHAQSQQQMQQQMLQQQAHHLSQSHQSHEDVRRYFGNMYPDQRRKDQHTSHSEAPLKATPPPNTISSKTGISTSSSKHKDKQLSEEKKEEKMKQEGVKPTMETQGPPPPPTSSYAYFPSSYLPSPHYGTIPFEQAHSMYRSISPMIVPNYGNSPYLPHPAQIHSQMPRYHAPEDLSRPPSGSATKALDMLHHQASQYYPSSHKIHELQERAIKSPTPKVSANPSPSAAPNGQQASLNPPQLTPTSTSDRLSAAGSMQNTKTSSIDSKDSRSPPPQRHVHTHHHTHVGIGYPILPGQYPAPYQAAVLASEQAAGVTSTGNNPYSPK